MGSEFHFREKIPVSILGATGSVGQRFVQLLASHPWFEIVSLAASERTAGKRYGDVVNWTLTSALPPHLAAMPIHPCEPAIAGKLAFSALDSSVAGHLETRFAEKGYTVVSNARNHRMDPNVPLLIPEVNPSHLGLLDGQQQGKIVTNPNCSAIGLCIALKPLQDAFGLDAVHVVTMQAVSGAGYPGIPSIDIMDNVVPHIGGEEDKLETEPLKILGKFEAGKISPAHMAISAQCNRVAVSDGHMACVSVKLTQKASEEELIQAWKRFTSEAQGFQLPTAPQAPIYYLEGASSPQPRLHRQLDKGMAVSIGRLRPCPLFDYKFALLSHNTIRGAAGGALLCAELMVRRGAIYW